jgi:hypothetical protein
MRLSTYLLLIAALLTGCERLLIEKEPFAVFEGKTTDPEQVTLSTRDVELFWRTYDAAATAPDKAAHWQQTYLDRTTPVVKSTLVIAKLTGANYNTATTQRFPKFLASIRTASLTGPQSQEAAIRQALRKMRTVHPEASFSGVYFGMGLFNNGGKSLPAGVYIGTEYFSQTPTTDLSELNAYTRSVMSSAGRLPVIVAHEMAHQQQRYTNTSTLLGAAIAEGSADFLGELASGEVATGGQTYTYGLANERAVWQAFSKEMTGTVWSNWLYNGSSGNAYNFPPDMGYFVGYRICKAYYDRAPNKQQALRDMLQTTDFPTFLAKSGYAEQWK